MKKANYALFQSSGWSSFLGKTVWAMVFAWCCLGMQEANAQDIVMSHTANSTNTCVSEKLDECGGSVDADDRRFTDDGSNDGNYADPLGVPRTDTVEICAKDQWHRVRVVFTDFDLAIGDTLNVYQGNKAAVRGTTVTGFLRDANGDFIDLDADGNRDTGPVSTAIPPSGTGTGVGVANAFGGWVDANCHPKNVTTVLDPGTAMERDTLSSVGNSSGCLTFILRTNGDNRKGAGWDAWVDCQDKDVSITPRGVVDHYLSCGELTATVEFLNPVVEACDVTQGAGDGLDKVQVKVLDQTDAVVLDNHVASTFSRTTWAGIGQFRVFYTLKDDPTKTASTTFSVQAPPLVANDDLSVPFGEGCGVSLTPDDILESTCPQIDDFMHYFVTITLGEGPKAVVLTTDTGATKNEVIYPTITKQNILDAGMSICDVTAQVTVERIYYKYGTPIPEYIISPFSEKVTTTVRIKDISKPVINAPASNSIIVVGCDISNLAALIGATASDNCDDDITVTSTSSVAADPCPATQSINVVFTATDDCGNTGTANRTYILERPTVIVKTQDVSEDCSVNPTSPVPGIEVGYRLNTDPVTTLRDKDTTYLSTTDYVCGYILVKTQEDVPNTDCGSKTYEYFDLIDWCAGANGGQRIDTTYIELTDKTAPVIIGEEGSFTYDQGTSSSSDDRTFGVTPAADIPLDDQSCTYDITKYAGPSATDACSSVSVRLDRAFRIENGVDWVVPADQLTALNCDSFRLMWIAEDACHEQLTNDTSFQIVEIKDVTAPSAVCQDAFTVSVPSDEGARLEIGDIDGGSSDACGIATREIRIKDSGDDWADHVIIGCEDVHEEVQVELRVTDNKGNTNICWTTVVAEDKIPPVCTNLEDMSLTCKDIHTGELGASTDADGDGQMEDDEWQPLTGDLMEVYNTRFGAPDCEDNLSCGTLTIEQEYQLIEEDCGALSARRRYRANDWKPNSSTWAEQLITVTYVADWTLNFPADIDLDCSNSTIPAPSTADDIIDNGSCDLWALEVTADTFEVGDGVCMKIERHYEVINWCVYTAGDPATVVAHDAANGASVSSEGNEDKGRYTYTQVIKLYITDAPTVTIDDVNTCIVGVGDPAPFYEEDQILGAPAYECDTVRTFSASATNCVGTALSDFEWKMYQDGVLSGEGDGASFPFVVYPGPTYTVEFWAFDGCGNSKGETRDFVFSDCKKPTPIVLNGIAIELGDGGTVDVWANDLDQNSFDNCTDQKDLETYLFVGGGAAGPTDLAGVRALGQSVTLTCNNVGTQTITFYVVDAAGNWDFVETYVLVQANRVDCSGVTEGEGMVAGKIVNPNGENVEQVAVSVTGAMQESMTTGADGTFQFDLNTDADYTVTPVKDMNPLNGVSTFDLVLISKHILGITTFDSPYKYIAADVNKSGSITAFDMVQLRQLILNINTEFANNDSWRFVDAKHDFALSTDNPAAQDFAEFMNINQLASNMMDVDFVGVKIGDVNGNAAANSLLGAETRSTNGTLNFNVTDRFVEAGETVTVDFRSADIETAQGYQFTMNFAGLNFDKLEEGVVKAANFNTNLAQRGLIATSWNGEATANDVLFSMTFNATASGLLSELVSVSSDITAAEAYNTDGDLLDVNIEFSAVEVAAGFALGQNSPNPFSGETVIGFNLPEAGSATLTVMDVQGKVLKSITADYAKGANQVTINANELGATGVLHYQLESADNVATKKMIIIE